MGISLVTRLRSEETSLRGESVLATSVTRVRWALSHIGVAVLATTLVMVLVGIAAGLADSQRTGDAAGSVGRLVGASIVTLPAVWVCVGIALRLRRTPATPHRARLGCPHRLPAARRVRAIFGLPEWLSRACRPSPTCRACRGGTSQWTPLVALTAVAAGLVLVGTGALRQRDFPTT